MQKLQKALNKLDIQLNVARHLFKISKSDTSRDAFGYAGYESVPQILLSVKVAYQIGS